MEHRNFYLVLFALSVSRHSVFTSTNKTHNVHQSGGHHVRLTGNWYSYVRKRTKCPRPRHCRPMLTKGNSFTEFWAKVMQSLYMPGQVLRVPGGWGSQISWQLVHEGGNVSLSHRPPLPTQEIFLVLISVREISKYCLLFVYIR